MSNNITHFFKYDGGLQRVLKGVIVLSFVANLICVYLN